MSFFNILNSFEKYALAIVLATGMATKAEAADQRALHLGPIDFASRLSMSEGYSDNIYFNNGQKIGSWFTTINPNFIFFRKWNRLDFNLSYGLNYRHYDSFTQNDTTIHTIKTSSHWVFNHRNQLDTTGYFVIGQNPIGFNLTQGTVVTPNSRPIDFTSQSYQATYRFGANGAQGNLIFRAGYSEYSYGNQAIQPIPQTAYTASSQNSYNIILGGTFLYKVMPKTSLLFEINQGFTKYDNKQVNSFNNDYSQTQYLIGATWKAAGKTTGTIKLGIFDLQYDDPNRVTNIGFTGSVSITWTPWTYSGFTLAAEQNNRPNLGIGTGSYINQKQVSIAWQYSWNPRLSHSAQLMANTQEYVNTNPAISDTNMGITLGLNYRMRSWLGLGLNYSYSKRDSNRNSYNFDQNMITLNVNMTL